MHKYTEATIFIKNQGIYYRCGKYKTSDRGIVVENSGHMSWIL
jgi:hypothetical protein